MFPERSFVGKRKQKKKNTDRHHPETVERSLPGRTHSLQVKAIWYPSSYTHNKKIGKIVIMNMLNLFKIYIYKNEKKYVQRDGERERK